jgi:hypothetical protein
LRLIERLILLSWRLGWWSRGLRWLRWRLILILWMNEIPRMSEDNARWKMHNELAGFNPVKLKLWKSVRFSSDELVDVTVVK